MKNILSLFVLLISFITVKSQSLNDFGTIASGAYTDTSIWRQWDGVGWNTVPGNYPNGSTQNVFINAGHIVNLPAPGPYNAGNLKVETGGKLYSNNSITNVYLSIWGTSIVCDGEIGNGSAFDGIAFNIDGPNCTINGTGTFTASRIRKISTINSTTNLLIETNVTLRWNQNSNTQFYNGIGTANNSTDTTKFGNFNLTITPGDTLNCEGSPGNPGNFSMDGVNGTSLASAGGQITVQGTLIIPGIMYATTNNKSTFYQVNLLVATGGLLRVGQINSPPSSTALSRITVQSGGKLELTALGFPVGTSNWSTDNNRYDFAAGSTVEYSAQASQNVLTQFDFQSASAGNNQYWHLAVSGSGIKTIRSGAILTARGNLTISGAAVLDQDANDVDIQVGGNWTSYDASGFIESTNNSKFVRFYGNAFPVQEILCPNGEQFQNLVIAKSSNATGAKVRMLSPVRVSNQFTLGLAGSSVTFGILELNQNTLTILNKDSSAIRLLGPSGYYRYIISENETNTSIVEWKIDTASGSYVIPFGISGAKDTIPVYFKKYSNTDVGFLRFSTYGTPSSNLPWPINPIAVTNLNGTTNPFPDNRDYTVDRFWNIQSTTQLNLDSLTLTYNNRSGSISELPTFGSQSNLRAQFWNPTSSSWTTTQLGSASLPQYGSNSVTIDNFNYSNTHWTLTTLYFPLPVELLEFDAEETDNGIRVFWSTATETNNDYFVLFGSSDGVDFDLLGMVDGKGNSSYLTNYSFFYDEQCTGPNYFKLCQVDYDGTLKCFTPIYFDCVRRKIPTLLRVYNFLGQEVTKEYVGPKILIFDNGSVRKTN